MNWAIGVTASPRPVDYLPATLASLAEAGWPDATVFAEPGTPIPPGQPSSVATRRCKPWQAFLRALGGLLEKSQADAVAIFQDDILLARNCRQWLEPQLWPDPRPGVVSLYVSEAQADGRSDGWSILDPDATPYGACAVVLPSESARLLVDNPPHREPGRMTDTWLGVFCERNGLPFYQHVPSLVRHVGRESSLARGGKRPIVRPWTAARHEGRFVEDATALAESRIVDYG